MKFLYFKHLPILVSLVSLVIIAIERPAQAENVETPHQTKFIIRPIEHETLVIAEPTFSQEQTLLPESSESEFSNNAAGTTAPQIAQTGVIPGRATRSGPSYIGVGGNIGFGGDTTLSEGAFAIISKVGLTRNLSVRPSVLLGDNAVFLIPLTVDFPSQGVEPINLGVAPYLGGGVALSTGRDNTIGALISGGVDVPLSPQFTATAGVNIGFIDETEVGLLLGVGYTFGGF